jgi:hypothetical protein
LSQALTESARNIEIGVNINSNFSNEEIKIMKRLARVLFAAVLSVVVFSTANVALARGNFGLGVIFGDPTALSAKIYQDHNDAFDIGLAFALSDYILIYGDYLRHFPGAFGHSSQFVSSLRPYIGIGPILVFDTDDHDRHHYFDREDNFALGARVPFGIEWIAPNIPLGISVEIVPGIEVIPSTDGFVQAGIAFRYYFQ